MRLRNGEIRGREGDGMHAVGCMEKLEDSQVSDFYFFTRETKEESVERLWREARPKKVRR